MPESTFEVYYEQVVMGANGNIRRGVQSHMKITKARKGSALRGYAMYSG